MQHSFEKQRAKNRERRQQKTKWQLVREEREREQLERERKEREERRRKELEERESITRHAEVVRLVGDLISQLEKEQDVRDGTDPRLRILLANQGSSPPSSLVAKLHACGLHKSLRDTAGKRRYLETNHGKFGKVFGSLCYSPACQMPVQTFHRKEEACLSAWQLCVRHHDKVCCSGCRGHRELCHNCTRRVTTHLDSFYKSSWRAKWDPEWGKVLIERQRKQVENQRKRREEKRQREEVASAVESLIVQLENEEKRKLLREVMEKKAEKGRKRREEEKRQCEEERARLISNWAPPNKEEIRYLAHKFGPDWYKAEGGAPPDVLSDELEEFRRIERMGLEYQKALLQQEEDAQLYKRIQREAQEQEQASSGILQRKLHSEIQETKGLRSELVQMHKYIHTYLKCADLAYVKRRQQQERDYAYSLADQWRKMYMGVTITMEFPTGESKRPGDKRERRADIILELGEHVAIGEVKMDTNEFCEAAGQVALKYAHYLTRHDAKFVAAKARKTLTLFVACTEEPRARDQVAAREELDVFCHYPGQPVPWPVVPST